MKSGQSQVTETLLEKRHTAAELLKCNFSLLWAPLKKFSSVTLCRSGSRNLISGHLKTQTISSWLETTNFKSENTMKLLLFLFCFFVEWANQPFKALAHVAGRTGRESAGVWPSLRLQARYLRQATCTKRGSQEDLTAQKGSRFYAGKWESTAG